MTAAPTETAAPDSPGPGGPPSGQAGLLLTEVRFAPDAGEPGFAELTNSGPTALAVTGTFLRLGATFVELNLVAPLAPGAQLLVLLDGKNTTDGTVIHAPVGVSLDPVSGSIALFDAAGTTLDHVAWGNGMPGAVATGPGGIVPDTYEPGSTIGRGPTSDWVVNSAGDASPGEPNPMPAVAVLLPLAGAILEPGKTSLDWYPVSGAASYRVQVAADPAFGSTVLDTTVSASTVDAGALAPGEYFWRVQAQGADGRASGFSDYSTFELAGAAGLTDGRALAAVGDLALVVDMPGTQLPVPLLSQHKDTAMLLLERNVEQGAHAWDVDHGTLDPTDPSDNKNCAIATVAMMNHFYGGDLSQDRIGYEVRKGTQPGPEWDLNYGAGISGNQVTEAFEFALGPGIDPYEYGSYEAMWDRIITEINAGRPIAAANSHHGFVITGYAVVGGRRLMTVNDPWRGSYVSNIDRAVLPAADFNFWRMPEGRTPTGRTQEPGVTADSDGDGVVDFDETERFKTDPHAKDSDGDKLPDKQDIITGIFDTKHGYAKNRTPDNDGRDYDFDGIPTELDPDSDRGGCRDGEEDKNLDGHRTEPETWNFDTQDDGASCGGWRGTITTTWNYVLYNQAGPDHQQGTLSATVLFEPDPTYAEACSGMPMNCYLIVTDGSATWSETGSHFFSDERGTHECTITGGGTYSLVVPGDDLKDPMSRRGQLRIWDEGDPGAFRYYGLGSASPAIDTPVTTTCPDQTSTHDSNQAQIWLDATDDNADSNTFPKDARSFGGTHTWTVQGGGLTQTWTWTFEKVGN